MKPQIEPKLKPFKRIVTGHNDAGRSIILEDAVASQRLAIGVPEHGVTDVWKTQKVPADNTCDTDPCRGPIVLSPPTRGSVFRIVEFPPDRDYLQAIDHKQAFSVMGKEAAESLTGEADIIMHRTASIDYVVMLEGEIYAVMDEGEALMKAGDVLVQRGTNHGWSNRSDKPAILAFILIAAEPVPLPGKA